VTGAKLLGSMRERDLWIPCTPGGTHCDWLASNTEGEAWASLLRDAAHMPYRGIQGFKDRGYTVDRWVVTKEESQA
jgi:hypothetical protein